MPDQSFARFRGKVALISGAADGICRASAEIIAAEGGTVAAVDINQELLDGAMQALAEVWRRRAPRLLRQLAEAGRRRRGRRRRRRPLRPNRHLGQRRRRLDDHRQRGRDR